MQEGTQVGPEDEHRSSPIVGRQPAHKGATEGMQKPTQFLRSSFRDWAVECTNFPRDVCKAALAHTIKNKAEAAYNRTDLFNKRADLMTAWAAFSTSKHVPQPI